MASISVFNLIKRFMIPFINNGLYLKHLYEDFTRSEDADNEIKRNAFIEDIFIRIKVSIAPMFYYDMITWSGKTRPQDVKPECYLLTTPLKRMDWQRIKSEYRGSRGKYSTPDKFNPRKVLDSELNNCKKEDLFWEKIKASTSFRRPPQKDKFCLQDAPRAYIDKYFADKKHNAKNEGLYLKTVKEWEAIYKDLGEATLYLYDHFYGAERPLDVKDNSPYSEYDNSDIPAEKVSIQNENLYQSLEYMATKHPAYIILSTNYKPEEQVQQYLKNIDRLVEIIRASSGSCSKECVPVKSISSEACDWLKTYIKGLYFNFKTLEDSRWILDPTPTDSGTGKYEKEPLDRVMNQFVIWLYMYFNKENILERIAEIPVPDQKRNDIEDNDSYLGVCPCCGYVYVKSKISTKHCLSKECTKYYNRYRDMYNHRASRTNGLVREKRAVEVPESFQKNYDTKH